MGDITIEQMSVNLTNYFARAGIRVELLRCYFSPQAGNFEYKILASPSLSVFNRTIEELRVYAGYKYEQLEEGGTFRLSRNCDRQFISCGDCTHAIKEAIAEDKDGEKEARRKGYIAFGKGNFDYIVTNMDEAAHLLIAGTTGSGKSCLLNSLIMELLCFSTASFILIDPKQGAEFGLYEQDIHKRINKVAKNNSEALEWLSIAVDEMERRYNEMQTKGLKKYDGNRIVVVIDELADLMMTSKKEVEPLIVRIAQKGRAAGIHLIVATQDPRASVVTGLIKYNLPTKVCLTTANERHSMNIIDVGKGAELLGKGDSYIKLPNSTVLQRCQCASISDREILNCITGKYDNK